MLKKIIIFFKKIIDQIPDMPLSEVNYVVVDTELTGLDSKKDSIISIGAVSMQGKKIFLGNSFHEIATPSTPLGKDSVKVHGMTHDELANRPSIASVFSHFKTYSKDAVLVGHFVSIDIEFLQQTAKQTQVKLNFSYVIDTLVLYYWLAKKLPNNPLFYSNSPRAIHTLYTIAESFNIRVENAHNALGDAYITAQVFQKMLPLLEQCGVHTLRSLVRVGNPKRMLSFLHNSPQL